MKKGPTKTAQRAAGLAANQALAYHFAAETAFRQGVFFAAMCGLTLKGLQREVGRGNWEDFCAANFGERLPDRTARKYMQVAEGLKLKVRRGDDGRICGFGAPTDVLAAFLKSPENEKISVGEFERRYSAETWELLETAPCRLSDAQRARLAAAVEHITDGETMASLIETYRLVKGTPGNAPAGGYKPSNDLVQAFLREWHPELVGTQYAGLTEPIQAEFREWYTRPGSDQLQLALDYYGPVIRSLDEDSSERRWIHLPRTEQMRLRDRMAAIVAEIDEALQAAS